MRDLLHKLDLKQLADTLEEVEPDFQANLLQHFPDEKVADVLEEMAPDEATDLLAELPDERRQGLLKLMERDEADEVRELLKYGEDTAGGLMTTEYISVAPDMTAAQTIEHLRKVGEEVELLYYVYVKDAEDHLVGRLLAQRLDHGASPKPRSRSSCTSEWSAWIWKRSRTTSRRSSPSTT